MPGQTRYFPLIVFSVLIVGLAPGTAAASQARAAAVAPPTPAAAIDMFVKMGGIDGESTASGHEGWIDVLSWSWGEAGSGGRQTPSGPDAGALTIVRRVERANARLTEACTGGRSLGPVVVHRRVGARYEEYTIEDSRISACSAGSRDGVAVETITFEYSKIDSPAPAAPARLGGDPDRPVVNGR